MRWVATVNAGAFALLRGDLAHAERLAEKALQIGADAGQPDAYMAYGGQLAQIRLCQGRGGEISELLEQSVAANPRLPAWRAALGQMLCWLGRREDAAAIVEDASGDGFAHVRWDDVRLTTLALYAEAASLADVRGAAGMLYRLIEPWAEQIVWTGATSFGHARTYLGLLASALDWEERADEHFAFSCDFHEAANLPLWAARAHLGWAEALARRGDFERSHNEAARALELSRAHGYVVFEPHAAALLTAQPPGDA
jgi:hypothetical protein